MDINTIVSVADHPPGRKGIPNITLQDCRFFGRPNFRGIENQFKDARQTFTVVIPNEVADQLRVIGYNVKTTIPTDEQKADGLEDISHLKVMVDSTGVVKMGMEGQIPSIITPENYAIVDMTRFQNWDCEIRGWAYNEEDFRKGVDKELKYSARLVQFVGIMRPNILDQKYGAVQ